MLSDAREGGNVGVPWFEPRFWIARGAVLAEARGRGQTWIVREGERGLVLRHYRRGGLIARLSKDRYVWRGEAATRPFREFELLARLHAEGLPVPRPVAARYLRRGATWSGDILVEFLPDTQTLAQRLSTGNVSLETWANIGRVIRRFHDAGVCHTDLNAHNILLRDARHVFLIDFDGGSRRRPGLWQDGNLVRLRRSLEKINDGIGAGRFDDAQWHCLLSAYRDAG
jgi:tRNA A-37 threonylcarbamoyl transferase component Bud32